MVSTLEASTFPSFQIRSQDAGCVAPSEHCAVHGRVLRSGTFNEERKKEKIHTSPKATETESNEMFTRIVLQHNLAIVTEFMVKGNLHSVLHDARVVLDWSVRMRMLRDICCGMGLLVTCFSSLFPACNISDLHLLLFPVWPCRRARAH